MLQFGPAEQNIVKQAVRFGEPIPDRMADAPEVTLGLGLYFTAYLELDSTRNGLEGRISFLSMKQYAEIHDFDEVQTEDLLYLIPKMDMAYLNFISSKGGKGGNASGPSGTSSEEDRPTRRIRKRRR